MTKIIIAGGGFGGLTLARGLVKRLPNSVSVTLIDKHDYQLFNTNLFEVATAEEELATVSQLKESIGIELKEALPKAVEFIRGEIKEINPKDKTVSVGGKQLPYDYLTVALGSVSDYFNIPGAEQFALPLKSFPNALRIKNQIEFSMQMHRQDMSKPNVKIIVAGGGYTGVEFAAELSHEIEFVAWKNQYPPEKVEICVVEAASQLIPGFSARLSSDALDKLKERGVRVELSSAILSVDAQFVELANHEKLAYDALVWTTGVKARSMPFTEQPNLDKKGRIITNQFLQSDKFQNIFALGDCAYIINADGRPAPASAQDAIAQGRYLAEAMPLLIQNKRPSEYKGKAHGFIVTLGGKYAIVDYGGFYIKGIFGYIVREGANFRFYMNALGFWKALKSILFQYKIFSRND